jgi:LAS superfamily LD-carboxypeptidase LdcB
MSNEAEKAGIVIKIASGTRNFNYQKSIWENKWNGKTLVDDKNLSTEIPDGVERFKKILEYSAAPGTSRHHWGTDIDINGITPGYFYTKEGKASYDWLVKNAPRFGFCQSYNEKNSRLNGYNEERWHWSYIPTARIFMEEYKKLVKEEDINGFLGDSYVKDLDLINNYVLSINPECF